MFLIYISDIHAVVIFSGVNHFGDVINLVKFNSCVKSINKQTNCDLKTLENWLNFSKIPINVDKAEIGFLIQVRSNWTVILKSS